MKTVRTAELDGRTVITGFDRRQIDPEGTKRNAADALKLTIEHTDCDTAYREVRELCDDLPPEMRKIKNPKLEGLVKVFEDKRAKCRVKLKQIARENPQYFPFRSGERKMDNLGELEEAFGKLTPTQLLTVEGVALPDNRGVEYYTRSAAGWESHTCSKLGVELPGDAVLPWDMSPGQRLEMLKDKEHRRVRALPAVARQAEMQERIDQAAMQAAAHRSALEVKGTMPSDALQQAKDQYAMLLTEIEGVYK